MTSTGRGAERTSKIVEAATQLFAGQGYHGTSTREIARLADISENTLFRHFEHKEDIFWTALRSQLDTLKVRRDLLDALASAGAPEVVLRQVIAAMVDTVTLKPELLRLLAVAFLEFRWKAEAVCREHLTPLFVAFRGYLAANMERGTLRSLDPSMLATAIAMTVVFHPAFSRLNSEDLSFRNPGGAIRIHSKFWLDALSRPDMDVWLPTEDIIESPPV